MVSSSVPTYPSGTTVTDTVSFYNSTGVLADPDTISCTYKVGGGDPGTTVTYADGQITKVSTGVYSFDFVTTWEGPGIIMYTLTWTGTGAVASTCDDSFYVRPVLVE